MFYFRIFPTRGSKDYFIVKYNNSIENNLSKIKELIWIWSKKYDAEIRDIRFENVNIKEHTADAKVYLRNNKIIDEKIIFIDSPVKSDEYLCFIEKGNRKKQDMVTTSFFKEIDLGLDSFNFIYMFFLKQLISHNLGFVILNK